MNTTKPKKSLLRVVSETEAIFNGSISITEFNDEFQVELPTEESDTLGGLIYTQLGHLPRVGDKVQIGNVELTVTGLKVGPDASSKCVLSTCRRTVNRGQSE